MKVTGKLRSCARLDYYLEADGGGYWLLAMPVRMAEDVDDLLHDRVVATGYRAGYADLFLVRIEAAAAPAPSAGCGGPDR